MRIAAIDYGSNIALAIAYLKISPSVITLRNLFLDTFVYNKTDLGLSIMYFAQQSDAIVMEQAPSRAAKKERETFDTISAILLQLEYKRGNGIREPNALVLVNPSNWKPFIKPTIMQ